MRGILGVGLLGVALSVSAGACDDKKGDEFAGALDSTSVDGGVNVKDVAPQIGYTRGRTVEYYDFGAAVTTTSAMSGDVAAALPMYWFFDKDTDMPLFAARRNPDGTPARDGAGLVTLDEGDPALDCYAQNRPSGAPCAGPLVQHPIVDSIPGRSDYTGFWEVVKVRVPKDYVKDTLKSYDTLLAAGYERIPLGQILQCSVVDLSSTLKPGITTSARTLRYAKIIFWFKRQIGSCLLVDGFDVLNVGAPVPALAMVAEPGLLGVASQPLMLPTFNLTTATGMISGPGPSSAIFDALPADPEYRPLGAATQVSVPATYVPGTYKALADIPPDAMTAPDTVAPFRSVTIRGEIPACMDDVPCTPVGLKCDTTDHVCRLRCAAQTDCDPFGTTCDMGRQVCTGG